MKVVLDTLAVVVLIGTVVVGSQLIKEFENKGKVLFISCGVGELLMYACYTMMVESWGATYKIIASPSVIFDVGVMLLGIGVLASFYIMLYEQLAIEDEE